MDPGPTPPKAVSRREDREIPRGFRALEDSGGTTYIRSSEHPRANLDPEALEGLALLTHPECPPQSPSDLVALDLETTGLSRGAGTLAFLTGLAVIEEHRVRTLQYLLPDPSMEAPYLEAISRELRERGHLVTFNGKGFDLPILSGRFTLNRMTPPTFIGHHDLLGPARRLWSSSLPSCRLTALEGSVLGRDRDGDVPGSEIPARYFDYLADGRSDLLDEVVHHNELDLLATIDLLFRMVRPLSRPSASPEHLAMARMAQAAGRQEIVEGQLKAATARARDDAEYLESLEELALYHRRRRDYARAVPLWMVMVSLMESGAGRISRDVAPYVELAKFAEHRLRDPRRALRYTERALHFDPGGSRSRSTDTVALHHRRNRLLRRLGEGDDVD